MHAESDGFRQTLTWRGGFWLALVIPMSGLTLIGYEVGAVGAWGALAIWLGTSVVALLQNFIYAELAGMHLGAARGMTVDLLFNLAVLFLVSNVAGIIFASNLGYLLSVVFALAGFLLLRAVAPGAERAIRLHGAWIPVAVLLVLLNIVMIIIGFTHPGLVGYGGGTEQLISLSVIVVGLLSYFFARYVQLGVRGRALWREAPGTAQPGHATAQSGVTAPEGSR